jgi:hypothetical protein
MAGEGLQGARLRKAEGGRRLLWERSLLDVAPNDSPRLEKRKKPAAAAVRRFDWPQFLSSGIESFRMTWGRPSTSMMSASTP